MGPEQQRECAEEASLLRPSRDLGRETRGRALLLVASAAVLAACALAALLLAPRSHAVLATPSAALTKSAAPTRIAVWYVNVEGEVDRDRCIRGQLESAGAEPQRYSADVLTNGDLGNESSFEEGLKTQGYGDCIRAGVDWPAVRCHGDAKNVSMEVVGHIISNWCSHKRLFSRLAEDPGAPDFVLVCEDDVFVNTTALLPELRRFVEARPSGWDLTVVDPFLGQRHASFGHCEDYAIGHHNGDAIWGVPQVASGDASTEGKKCLLDRKCSMCGAQAWLLRRSALRRVVSVMESIPAVPLDWLPRQLPGAIAWRPNIANNPKRLNLSWPAFCASNVTESNIDGHIQ
mmetsp:Transcript_100243/g.283877  ORF Transcript_100243/g.283877 Transcript_100243/m.283877 type:complete len:346 (-) Transcript_100243:254-1291(-)